MSDRLEQLHKLHDADPTDAELPYMIAFELTKTGQTTEAIDWLDKALALDPGFHYAYFQKAKVLDREGETDDALAVLDAGIAKASADGAAKAVGELQDLRQIIGG